MGIHCQGSTCLSSLSWFVPPPLCPLRLMPMPLSCTEDTAMVLVPMVILDMLDMLVILMPMVLMPILMPMEVLDTSTPTLTPDTTDMPVSIITVRDLLMLRLLPPLMLMPMPTTDTTATTMLPMPTAMPTVP